MNDIINSVATVYKSEANLHSPFVSLSDFLSVGAISKFCKDSSTSFRLRRGDQGPLYKLSLSCISSIHAAADGSRQKQASALRYIVIFWNASRSPRYPAGTFVLNPHRRMTYESGMSNLWIVAAIIGLRVCFVSPAGGSTREILALHCQSLGVILATFHFSFSFLIRFKETLNRSRSMLHFIYFFFYDWILESLES